MINEIREARDSPNVAYSTFLLHLSDGHEGVFCFFEGRDSAYYVSRVKNIFLGSYFPIRCKSKANVVKVNSLIKAHSEYEKLKIGYFVDRDFDLPLGIDGLYETPTYSVENFYTSVEVFGEILKSELGLSIVDDSYKRCIDVYEKLQNEYHEKTAKFNAWYACYIRKRKELDLPREVRLGQKIPSKFVRVSLDGIESNYTLEGLSAEYPNSANIEENEVETKIAEHSGYDLGKIFRGKFEMHFMVTILSALIADSTNAKNYINEPITYGVNGSLALNQFSQYAITPPCLLTYLTEVVGK